MNQLTITGMVATTPRFIPTETGSVLTFRFYHQDEDNDQTGSWLTGSVFGIMADEAYSTIGRGDRITLSGKLIVRDWDNGQYSGTAVEIKVGFYRIEQKWNPSMPVSVTHSCNCNNCGSNEKVA